MKDKIEKILNLFPEVKWDRFCGELDSMKVFGWIDREDGKKDFLVLFIDAAGCCLCFTSSAKLTDEFSRRLGFETHEPCKRVEEHFKNVNAIKLDLPRRDADGTFHCLCGAKHNRGALNGANIYRCMACGGTHAIFLK